MKKLLERLRADGERSKLLASVAGVVLVVIAAMLLPMAFRSERTGEADNRPFFAFPTGSARNGSGSTAGFTPTTADGPSSTTSIAASSTDTTATTDPATKEQRQ